jgi:ACS family hexuronate transporter-like MFS transporter
LLWLIPWLWLYRRPEEHSRITDAERAMLAESRANEAQAALTANVSDSADWGRWWQLFARREVWLLIFGRMLTDPVWYFFQFWFAKYLYDQRGLDQKQLTVTWVVYFAADIGVLGGGWLSGLLIKRQVLPARSRLLVMLGCAALVPAAAAIPLFDALWLVMAIGMLAVLAHMAWLINLSALVVDLVPKRSLGFTFGIVATGSSLGGLMMNKAVGALVTNLSYDPAFYFMLLLHPLAWILVWQLRPRARLSGALHPVST